MISLLHNLIYCQKFVSLKVLNTVKFLKGIFSLAKLLLLTYPLKEESGLCVACYYFFWSLWNKLVFIKISKLPGRMSVLTYFIQLPKTLEKLYLNWNELFKKKNHKTCCHY